MTKKQVIRFQEECGEAVLEACRQRRPGLPSVVLAEGAVLLEKFKAELEAKRARREDLLEVRASVRP